MLLARVGQRDPAFLPVKRRHWPHKGGAAVTHRNVLPLLQCGHAAKFPAAMGFMPWGCQPGIGYECRPAGGKDCHQQRMSPFSRAVYAHLLFSSFSDGSSRWACGHSARGADGSSFDNFDHSKPYALSGSRLRTFGAHHRPDFRRLFLAHFFKNISGGGPHGTRKIDPR